MKTSDILSKYSPDTTIGEFKKQDVIDMLNKHFEMDCVECGFDFYNGHIRYLNDLYTLLFAKDNNGYFVSGVYVSQAYLQGCMGITWEFVGAQAREMDTAITRFLGQRVKDIV